MSVIKEKLLYTKSHEWVQVEGDLARIGITDYAIKEMGALVYAETAPVGRKITAGKAVGAVESVKIAADLFSPVSGEIVEVWPNINSDQEKISADPFGVWFVAIRLSDPSELKELMDADAYAAFCESGD